MAAIAWMLGVVIGAAGLGEPHHREEVMRDRESEGEKGCVRRWVVWGGCCVAL